MLVFNPDPSAYREYISTRRRATLAVASASPYFRGMPQIGDDQRRYIPAVQSNRGPILDVLREVLPAAGTLLEIGSGTGEHAAWFAPLFPGLIWQPSEPDRDFHASIRAWSAGIESIRPPLALDARDDDWGIAAADAIVCINVIHIAPWAVAQGLMRGAGRLLAPDGPLCLYGPYMRDGRHTAPSNAAFDRFLRDQDPDWGVRDLAAVTAEAKANGLALDRVVEMPANNLSVILRRQRGESR